MLLGFYEQNVHQFPVRRSPVYFSKVFKTGGGEQKWEVKAEALNIKKEGKEEEKTLYHGQRKVLLAKKLKTEK